MNFARIWCIPNPTPARRVTPPWNVYMAKFDPGLEGLPGLADRTTRLGGSPYLACKLDPSKMRDYMDRRVTPPKRVTSPTWGTPSPCKQTLNLTSMHFLKFSAWSRGIRGIPTAHTIGCENNRIITLSNNNPKPSTQIDHSRNTITYHNVLCLSPQNFA